MNVTKTTQPPPTFRSRPRFLCDVDDVLASYVQGFTAAVIATGVRSILMDHPYDDWDLSKSLKLTDEEETKVYSLINSPGFASMLMPCAGAVDGLKAVMKVADVLFVTSPLKSSPTWAYDRRRWLEKYFGEEQGRKIISTSEKYAVDGDFLLDDKPEHCIEWQAEHPAGTALLWATGRNLAGKLIHSTVNSWELVYELVNLKAKMMKMMKNATA